MYTGLHVRYDRFNNRFQQYYLVIGQIAENNHLGSIKLMEARCGVYINLYMYNVKLQVILTMLKLLSSDSLPPQSNFVFCSLHMYNKTTRCFQMLLLQQFYLH